MRTEKALLRLQSMGERPIYKRNGKLIFCQKYPHTALIISILALIASLLK